MSNFSKTITYIGIILVVIVLALQFIRLYDGVQSAKQLNDRPLVDFELVYDTKPIAQIANDDMYQIIDVREPEEFAQQRIIGAKHIRVSDVLRSENATEFLEDVVGNKIPVFYCHESNYLGDGAGRSGLLASYFTQLGIESYAVEEGIDGIRNLDNSIDYLSSFNESISIFPNIDKKLTSIASIQSIVIVDSNHKSIVVSDASGIIYDTNYTGGDMTSQEWDELLNVISQLPGDSVAVICYDNPTCFMANILGLRLSEKVFEGYAIGELNE